MPITKQNQNSRVTKMQFYHNGCADKKMSC